MDVTDLIDALSASIAEARALPMSSSAVVNRSELLDQIQALKAAVSEAVAASEKVLSDRDHVLAEARAEAERIVAEATAERDRLVSDSEVHRSGTDQAEQTRADTEEEFQALRRETDEYVDERLANLEVTLVKTLEAVTRGRERLQGRSELDRLGPDADESGPLFSRRR